MDDRSYIYDSRVVAGERGAWYVRLDEKRMKAIVLINFEHEEEGCVEEEREVPFKYEVCPTCDGKGSHVNPSIDAGGISSDEWAEWDDEERESYMGGRYDVPCYECHGARVVPELDSEHADPFVVKCLDESAREEAEYRAISRAERAMGA